MAATSTQSSGRRPGSRAAAPSSRPGVRRRRAACSPSPAREYSSVPLSALSFEPELAVQSFPLIIELDGSPGIRSDDGKRAARTIACTTVGSLRFIVLTARDHEGPTLHETMSLL